jgi:cystathionine gamma-lyase
MDHHLKTAFIAAKWLEKQPKVENVLHPALPSHPNHAIALSQSYGHSGVFSFIIKDANLEKIEKFFQSLKVFMLIESPGGFESFMRSPVMTTYKEFGEEELKGLNITEGLVTVSIGLEDPEDLVNDIREALKEI